MSFFFFRKNHTIWAYLQFSEFLVFCQHTSVLFSRDESPKWCHLEPTVYVLNTYQQRILTRDGRQFSGTSRRQCTVGVVCRGARAVCSNTSSIGLPSQRRTGTNGRRARAGRPSRVVGPGIFPFSPWSQKRVSWTRASRRRRHSAEAS